MVLFCGYDKDLLKEKNGIKQFRILSSSGSFRREKWIETGKEFVLWGFFIGWSQFTRSQAPTKEKENGN